MRLALEVWSNDFAKLKATCLHAESLGIDGFYYGESPHDLNLECWTTLAALAQTTEQIRLGPVITNVLPTYRSTRLLARQAGAVAAISNGRLDFRTGVGASVRFGRPWWETFGVTYPDYNTRLAETEAAIQTLSDAWADTAWPVPITAAATGQRAMAMAAGPRRRLGDLLCDPFGVRRSQRRDGSATGRQVDRPVSRDRRFHRPRPTSTRSSARRGSTGSRSQRRPHRDLRPGAGWDARSGGRPPRQVGRGRR